MAFTEIHTFSRDASRTRHQRSFKWQQYLKKAVEWSSRKAHKKRQDKNLPEPFLLKSNRHKTITELFKPLAVALLNSEGNEKGCPSLEECGTNQTKVPRAAKVESEKIVTHDKSFHHDSALSYDGGPRGWRAQHAMEMLQGLIYEEDYTIEDVAKLLRISSTNYAIKILTDQKRYAREEKTQRLRVRVDYAIAVMTTRKGVTLEEIAEVLGVPTNMWVMRTSPIHPVLGSLSFDCTFSSLLPPLEIEKDDKPSPWILSVFVLPHDNSAPTRAQCTLDTGNYQGNIVSRAFLLALGYSESKFRPLAEDEKLGGIDASGETLLPLGAVNLTWYASKSTRIFRDVRFLVSPYNHYDLIIAAPFIEKHGLLGAPNLAIKKVKSDDSIGRPSSILSAQTLTNPPHLSELEESDPDDIATPSTLNDDIYEISTAGDISPANNALATESFPDIPSEPILPSISESNIPIKRPFPCEEDAPLIESKNVESSLSEAELKSEACQTQDMDKPFENTKPSDDLSSTAMIIPTSIDEAQQNTSSVEDHAAPTLMNQFKCSEQGFAITAAVTDITKNLSSFAVSYLISKFESQFTQCMGQGQGTSSGTSKKGISDGKEKGKQRDNGKRRRTSKNGAYENGDDEEGERDDDDDNRQEEDKDGQIRPMQPGGWGCIFHIQYPDWYHPQNLCLSSKGQQKFNHCATKGFRRLDELIKHIVDVHQLPEFVCIRCRTEFSSQEQHYEHSISCERKPFRNIKFGIDQKMKQELSSLPKKPRDQTFLERWHLVFNIIFPGQTPPSPYFEEGAKRFGKYNTYLKDAIPNLAKKYLTKATNEMKLGDELRQYVQAALDRIIENSFPDILRDASEGFRAQEIADRNQSVVPSHNGLPPANAPSPKLSSSANSSADWHPFMSPDSEHTLDVSGAETNTLTSPSISRDTKTRSADQIDGHQEHYLLPSMTQNPYSSFGAMVAREKQEHQQPVAVQNALDIHPQMQTSESAMFESQAGWQAADLRDATYDWDLEFQAEHSLSDEWD